MQLGGGGLGAGLPPGPCARPIRRGLPSCHATTRGVTDRRPRRRRSGLEGRERRDLKPKRSPNKPVIRVVADFDGKLPADATGDRVFGKISKSSRCRVPSLLDGLKVEPDVVGNEAFSVPRVEEVMWHDRAYTRVRPLVH